VHEQGMKTSGQRHSEIQTGRLAEIFRE